MRIDPSALMAEVSDAARLIHPVLADRPRHVQACILIDLVSTFLTGFEPATRITTLTTMVDAIREINDLTETGERQ